MNLYTLGVSVKFSDYICWIVHCQLSARACNIYPEKWRSCLRVLQAQENYIALKLRLCLCDSKRCWVTHFTLHLWLNMSQQIRKLSYFLWQNTFWAWMLINGEIEEIWCVKSKIQRVINLIFFKWLKKSSVMYKPHLIFLCASSWFYPCTVEEYFSDLNIILGNNMCQLWSNETFAKYFFI